MSSAAKLGVFMLVILAVLGYFVLKIEDVQIGRGARTKKVTAIFDSVAGLDKKSTVRVAGVRVGKVEDVKLRSQDGKAEVTLDIDSDVKLHRNATARVANLGLLGEKYVELDPGPANSPAIPQEQAVVLRGTQPASMDDVTNQVAAIAEEEQHHPDISLAWGKVGITIWTHAIDGLSRSDFVLAAKIDRVTSDSAQ